MALESPLGEPPPLAASVLGTLRRLRWRLAEGALLLLAAIPQVWAVAATQGIVWPDEIHQSVEQAHRLAFGYGCLPWEFDLGLRSWFYPGVLAGIFKLAVWLIGDHARLPVLLARGMMAALSVASVWLTARLGRRIAGREAGIWAGLLLATFPPWILYGSRCLSEMASAPLLLGAAMALRAPPERRGGPMLAGGLVAAACFLRCQNGIVFVVFLAALFREGRRSALWRYLGGAASVAAAGGALDWVTWGRPFKSLLAYVQFNLLAGGAAGFGVQSADFFPRVLWSATGPALIVLGLLFVAGARQWRALACAVIVYGALHSAVSHKELRFLLPVVPLAFVLIGVGAVAARRRWPHVALAVMLFGATNMEARAFALDGGDVGYDRYRNLSAWHLGEPYNRLLWAAAARPDVCGLAVVGTAVVWTGGHSYFHRNAPLLMEGDLERDQGRTANYAIAPLESFKLQGYRSVAQEGPLHLLRREGPCAPVAAGFRQYFPRP
jgi:phosphatidylinositol glycan class B